MGLPREYSVVAGDGFLRAELRAATPGLVEALTREAEIKTLMREYRADNAIAAGEAMEALVSGSKPITKDALNPVRTALENQDRNAATRKVIEALDGKVEYHIEVLLASAAEASYLTVLSEKLDDIVEGVKDLNLDGIVDADSAIESGNATEWAHASELRREYDALRDLQQLIYAKWFESIATRNQNMPSDIPGDADDRYVANLDDLWPAWSSNNPPTVFHPNGPYRVHKCPWPDNSRTGALVWLAHHAILWVPRPRDLDGLIQHRREQQNRRAAEATAKRRGEKSPFENVLGLPKAYLPDRLSVRAGIELAREIERATIAEQVETARAAAPPEGRRQAKDG